MSKSDIASIHNDGYWTCMEEKMYQKIEGSGWESKCCSSRVKARKGLSVLTIMPLTKCFNAGWSTTIYKCCKKQVQVSKSVASHVKMFHVLCH